MSSRSIFDFIPLLDPFENSLMSPQLFCPYQPLRWAQHAFPDIPRPRYTACEQPHNWNVLCVDAATGIMAGWHGTLRRSANVERCILWIWIWIWISISISIWRFLILGHIRRRLCRQRDRHILPGPVQHGPIERNKHPQIQKPRRKNMECIWSRHRGKMRQSSRRADAPWAITTTATSAVSPREFRHRTMPEPPGWNPTAGILLLWRGYISIRSTLHCHRVSSLLVIPFPWIIGNCNNHTKFSGEDSS